MATAKVPKSDWKNKVQSKKLTNSSTKLCRVYQSDTIFYVVLSWRLPAYDKMEEDVVYYEIYKHRLLSCTIRALKRSSDLYLCVVGNTIPFGSKAEFTVMGEPSLRSMAKMVNQGEPKIFITEFPRKSLFSPCLDNLLRGDSAMTVSFKYEEDIQVAYKTCKMEDPDETLGDLSAFCCDLTKLYYESLNPDFLILLGSLCFKTHKFILCGRSDYFRALITQNRNAFVFELKRFRYPGIVHEFLVYLYSGNLREMDLPSMLWMYDLAVRFSVSSLFNRCNDYFKTTLDKENCRAVALFAIRKKHAALKNIVAYFLPTAFPGITIVEFFKDVEREYNETPPEVFEAVKQFGP